MKLCKNRIGPRWLSRLHHNKGSFQVKTSLTLARQHRLQEHQIQSKTSGPMTLRVFLRLITVSTKLTFIMFSKFPRWDRKESKEWSTKLGTSASASQLQNGSNESAICICMALPVWLSCWLTLQDARFLSPPGYPFTSSSSVSRRWPWSTASEWTTHITSSTTGSAAS